MADTIYVSLPLRETVEKLDESIVGGSITGERIDYFELSAPENTRCIVLVYEKHYYRAGNRLTLTVTVDDLSGRTRVNYISGGGGEGLFRFDWGASESFANIVYNTLAPYLL